MRPSDSTAAARSMTAPPSPSAPPSANTSAGTPASRQAASRSARSRLVHGTPRSSSATRVAPGGAAAGDDHVVGDRRLAGEVEGGDVLGLAVFETVDDPVQQFGRLKNAARARPQRQRRDRRGFGEGGGFRAHVWFVLLRRLQR